MKNLILIAGLIFIALWGSAVQAFDKVIYGIDNRKEVFESPSKYADWANSTAAMISNSSLKANGDKVVISAGRTLEAAYNLCSTERFLKQPTPAMCSGFLVGPNLLVTAGHCIKTMSDCSSYSWVFDYNMKNDDEANLTVSASSVYKCKSIVARELDRTTKNDFALITLDRNVEGRAALPVRKSGKVSSNSELVVIGHPSGLPNKITDGGTMRVNTNSVFFVANLDTFAGNSGSVVLDAKTGTVEGILVRGENDYVSTEDGCSIANVCLEGQCRGEDVTRITNLSKYLKKKTK